MGALVDKCVGIAARLLASTSGAKRRLSISSAIKTSISAGTVGGLLVALVLITLPRPIVDFSTEPGLERLKTLMVFMSLVGGGFGGVYLLASNHLLLNISGYLRAFAIALVFSTSALLVIGIHCVASHKAFGCSPNMEWGALGLAEGLTTTIAATSYDLRRLHAPLLWTWRNLTASLAGLVMYEAVHFTCLHAGLGFPHMGRGLVTAAASFLYLEVLVLALWLQTGGLRLLRVALSGRE